MRNSISHPKKMTSKAFVRTTRPTKLLCLGPDKKKILTREIASLTGSSSREALSRPGNFWRKKCNLPRGMTLHLHHRSTRPFLTLTHDGGRCIFFF